MGYHIKIKKFFYGGSIGSKKRETARSRRRLQKKQRKYSGKMQEGPQKAEDSSHLRRSKLEQQAVALLQQLHKHVKVHYIDLCPEELVRAVHEASKFLLSYHFRSSGFAAFAFPIIFTSKSWCLDYRQQEGSLLWSHFASFSSLPHSKRPMKT